VIIVDWGHGSKTDYQHAAANTFVVGAETSLLLKYLHDNHGLKYSDVHVIGHSLGAQTAGHVGHAVPTLARITGDGIFMVMLLNVYETNKNLIKY
jgi:pancreatic triacylglycerol lipase